MRNIKNGEKEREKISENSGPLLLPVDRLNGDQLQHCCSCQNLRELDEHS